MRRGSALLAVVALAAAVPAGHHRGGHHKERHGDECRRDCHNSDNDGRGGDRRQYCIMPCNIIVPIPTPAGEAPPDREESALPAPDPRCAPFHCDPKPTALFPPDPAKLTELIQSFASGMGKSVGDLAGAVAAFPPALLLSGSGSSPA